MSEIPEDLKGLLSQAHSAWAANKQSTRVTPEQLRSLIERIAAAEAQVAELQGQYADLERDRDALYRNHEAAQNGFNLAMDKCESLQVQIDALRSENQKEQE